MTRGDPTSPLSEQAVEAGARLVERALALPLPLTEAVREGEHELTQGRGMSVGWLASFERRWDDPSARQVAVAEQARSWLEWLTERWARRWGPAVVRTPAAWKLLETPVRFRPASNVAQLCWNESLREFVAWSRGGRWFGAGLCEPGDDTTVFLMCFVGLIGEEDTPPGPPGPSS